MMMRRVNWGMSLKKTSWTIEDHVEFGLILYAPGQKYVGSRTNAEQHCGFPLVKVVVLEANALDL